MRGRLFRSTASRAAAATSARITMPGPPPAGLSSTVRCLPRPWSRMSRISRDQRWFANPLPSSEIPSGPGNISGNSVRTVADQLLDIGMRAVGLVFFRHRDLNTATGNIDHRHGLACEGQQHFIATLTSIGRLAGDDDDVAGAEIVDGR